jgi:hypothetical protein
MAEVDLSNLANLLLDPTEHWLSGIYESCGVPTVIVVSKRSEGP